MLQGLTSTAGDYLKNIPYLGGGTATAKPGESKVAAPTKDGPQLTLSEHGFEEFASLVSLNDKISVALSEDFSEEDLKKYELIPPRVIVVGLTSAGKSSLLERVIGFPIFPVRDNVCTRRPFAVHMKNDPQADKTVLRFGGDGGPEYVLPDQIDQVRKHIEAEQKSQSDDVEFSAKEIHAEIRSKSSETFTFTDLPGIFLVSERKMGSDYAKSRAENERLKQHTMEITKKYLAMPNTICLVVISSTDWMHGMNNDNLISYLAEWLEEIRKDRDVPVYGVITKLDTQDSLSANSPIKKILQGQLPKDHILHGLRVRRWVPVINSPAVLAETDKAKAALLELDTINKCLKNSNPPMSTTKSHVGRTVLLKQLKKALLLAIGLTHDKMRKKIDEFVWDLDQRLDRLPQPAPVQEKRRIFDSRLKVMETELQDLIGPRGRLQSDGKEGRSLRMQLMVDAPAHFEKNLNGTSLRGGVMEEVKQILNQAALEQGGSFDSDISFNNLSQKIIQRYAAPCLLLVETCANIVRGALKTAARKAFGDYKDLEELVLSHLGLSVSDEIKEKEDNELLYGFLKNSATGKVMNLLDAFETMTCFHPMWRNFDVLYQNILMKDDGQSRNQDAKAMAESTLQQILSLPALAKIAREEGELAIATYERETKQPIALANRQKISKHFARVEVMGYIVRTSLISSVYPLVVRDLRDGLFRGIKSGTQTWDHSVSTLLRMKLVFDQNVEKRVFELMEPSADDLQTRARLAKKKDTLVGLKTEFGACQSKLKKLVDIMNDKS